MAFDIRPPLTWFNSLTTGLSCKRVTGFVKFVCNSSLKTLYLKNIKTNISKFSGPSLSLPYFYILSKTIHQKLPKYLEWFGCLGTAVFGKHILLSFSKWHDLDMGIQSNINTACEWNVSLFYRSKFMLVVKGWFCTWGFKILSFHCGY